MTARKSPCQTLSRKTCQERHQVARDSKRNVARTTGVVAWPTGPDILQLSFHLHQKTPSNTAWTSSGGAEKPPGNPADVAVFESPPQHSAERLLAEIKGICNSSPDIPTATVVTIGQQSCPCSRDLTSRTACEDAVAECSTVQRRTET